MKNVVVVIIKSELLRRYRTTYVDKAQRIGIRMVDLLEKETFERRLKENIEVKNAYFKGMFNETCPRFDEIFDEYYAAGQRLKEFVTDTSKILDDAFVVKKKFYLKVHKVSC